MFIYQRLSSMSRTHIETGIYFRWDDPDDDSAASSLSTLNDARLGSYVLADDRGVAADVSATSCDSAALQDVAETSSTDGNNNDVSFTSEERTSSTRRTVANSSPSRDAATLVSSFLIIHK